MMKELKMIPVPEKNYLGEIALTGDETSFRAMAQGGEAWVDDSFSSGVILSDTQPGEVERLEEEEDLFVTPQVLDFSKLIPIEYTGLKVKGYRVTLELEFEDQPQTPPESPEAA